MDHWIRERCPRSTWRCVSDHRDGDQGDEAPDFAFRSVRHARAPQSWFSYLSLASWRQSKLVWYLLL
jgi:hypothetical protein